jgi:hypothetical protein
MTDDAMAAANPSALACPKDGTEMKPAIRRGRGNLYRCPECRGVFLNIDAVRGGRAGQPPAWASVAVSILMSLAMTLLVRRLRRPR